MGKPRVVGWYGDNRTTLAVARLGALAFGCLALANCSSSTSKLTSRVDPKYGVSASPRVVEPGQPVPKGGGVYRVGKPYQVAGVTYTPQDNRRYRNEGLASWYGDDFHGRLTANGEVYDMEGISAAHPTLPMPSYVRVTNLKNSKSLIVRVNDRGPYHANREIDLSAKAADLLGYRGHGVARVRVEYVGAAPMEGTDDRQLMATLRDGQPAPAPANVMIASNRFLPNFERPSQTRGDTPMPQERPYDLGEGNGRVASSAYPQMRSARVEAPVDARRLAVEALARQPSRARMVETSPDTTPTAYSPPRARQLEARNLPSTEVTSRSRSAGVAPVAAYAPMYFDGGAVSTGRGLY